MCLSVRPTIVLIASKSSSQLIGILESLCLVVNDQKDNENEESDIDEDIMSLQFSLEIRLNK